MARRKSLFHPDDVKKKIRTSQLINRLTDHALSDAPIMDASQVQAARALIDKVIPNTKHVEHTGPGGGAIQTEEVGAAATKLNAYLDTIASRAPSGAE